MKLSLHIAYNQATQLLGTFPRKTFACVLQEAHTKMFIAALFTRAQNRKQLECPLAGEWINKFEYIHIMEHHTIVIKEQTILNNLSNLRNIMRKKPNPRKLHSLYKAQKQANSVYYLGI